MKKWTTIVVPSVVASLVLLGCGKSETEQQAPSVDTSRASATASTEAQKASAQAVETTKAATGEFAKLQDAFQSAEADTRSAVEKAVDLAKAGKTADALKELQALAAKAKLTPEQQQVLKDVIAQLQKQMVSSGVEKTATDLKKSLPLGQ